MAGIPIVGPALGAAAAAAAIVSGIANVKKIWEVNESATGAGVGSTSPAPPALNISPVEYTRNLLGDRETEELNKPIKCYMLESEASAVMTKVKMVESNASF